MTIASRIRLEIENDRMFFAVCYRACALGTTNMAQRMIGAFFKKVEKQNANDPRYPSQIDENILKEVKLTETQQNTRRKRGSYTVLTPEVRAKVGKYAAENGNTKAANKFTDELGTNIAESTVNELYLQLLSAYFYLVTTVFCF